MPKEFPQEYDRGYKDWLKLTKYMTEHPDERMFQALANCYGFPYLGSANSPYGAEFKDLFYRESE